MAHLSIKKIASILALIVGLLSAQAIPSSAEANTDAARAVITDQLESFLSGDFSRAYSYASPTIKRLFPTQERFMSMVQSGYLPVLRPGNYAYGETTELNSDRIRQDVLIRAPDGTDWTATYIMARQPDGMWKVDAVMLKKGAAGMI